MPAGYSQKSAQLRAERQATAGYRYVGGDPSDYENVNGIIRSKVVLGPDLPYDPPGDSLEWDDAVREYYHAFRTSPQAALLATDVEWRTVLIAMGLLNTYYAYGALQAFTKFEALMGQFGVTPAAQRKLRVAVTDPQADEKAEAKAREAAGGEMGEDEQQEFEASFEAIVASMK